jgi:alkylhydroperoxidase/carboxymuconolactone decarboxylase family protein YurZ
MCPEYGVTYLSRRTFNDLQVVPGYSEVQNVPNFVTGSGTEPFVRIRLDGFRKGSWPMKAPNPPKAYDAFRKRYPGLGRAWDAIHEAGREGPLDEKTARLVKLGIAIGAMREGAIHSSVRKATALGISPAEIDQVIALAAGTLGLPSTVAVYTWITDRASRSEKNSSTSSRSASKTTRPR